MLESVPQHMWRKVIYSQSPIQISHSYQRQAANTTTHHCKMLRGLRLIWKSGFNLTCCRIPQTRQNWILPHLSILLPPQKTRQQPRSTTLLSEAVKTTFFSSLMFSVVTHLACGGVNELGTSVHWTRQHEGAILVECEAGQRPLVSIVTFEKTVSFELKSHLFSLLKLTSC